MGYIRYCLSITSGRELRTEPSTEATFSAVNHSLSNGEFVILCHLIMVVTVTLPVEFSNQAFPRLAYFPFHFYVLFRNMHNCMKVYDLLFTSFSRMESTEKCEVVIQHFNGKYLKTPPGIPGKKYH